MKTASSCDAPRAVSTRPLVTFTRKYEGAYCVSSQRPSRYPFEGFEVEGRMEGIVEK